MDATDVTPPLGSLKSGTPGSCGCQAHLSSPDDLFWQGASLQAASWNDQTT